MKRAEWAGVAIGGVSLAAIGAAVMLGRRRHADELEAQAAQTPATSAPASPMEAEAKALARVITSEAQGYSLAERTAIAWTVRNRAQRRRVSVARLVCWPTCGPCCEGRPFSSARQGTAEDLALAREVLAAEPSADPTRKAMAFFEPAVQDRLMAANQRAIAVGLPPPYPSYRRTAAKVRQDWAGAGQYLIASVGGFEFWT